MRETTKTTITAAAVLLAAAWSAPAFAAGAITMGSSSGANGSDASEAQGPGRVFSAGGMIYAPRLMPMGHVDSIAVGGAAFPSGAASTLAATRPIGGLAATGRISDNLEWAAALSPDSQVGIGQRYTSSDHWVWAGAYLARGVFMGGAPDYGATYRQALMYTTGALDLVLQPEASYYMTAGPQLAVALGADLWATPAVVLGLNYQVAANLAGKVPSPHRVGAGAKVLLTDKFYLMANGQYMMSEQVTTATAGVGYYF